MRAEIDAKGVLIVEAETQLESYALGKWLEDNQPVHGRIKDDNLLICRLPTLSDMPNSADG